METDVLQQKIEEVEESIGNLQARVGKIELAHKKEKGKRKKAKDFPKFSEANRRRFLAKSKDKYNAVDLIYYWEQETERAGRPQPILNWGFYHKAKKVSETVLNFLSPHNACDYIDYTIHGQTNVENPRIWILITGWAHQFLNEMDEWLQDREFARKIIEEGGRKKEK